VNDLPDAVKNSKVSFLADDTKVFKCIDSVSDAGLLQSDLSIVPGFYLIKTTIDKCKIKRITREKNPIDFPYEIKSKTLDISLEEKDLGIWVTGALTWSKHTFYRCAKANKLLGFLHAQICCGNKKSKHLQHALPGNCASCSQLN
jgi:hypothetical protein